MGLGMAVHHPPFTDDLPIQISNDDGFSATSVFPGHGTLGCWGFISSYAWTLMVPWQCSTAMNMSLLNPLAQPWFKMDMSEVLWYFHTCGWWFPKFLCLFHPWGDLMIPWLDWYWTWWVWCPSLWKSDMVSFSVAYIVGLPAPKFFSKGFREKPGGLLHADQGPASLSASVDGMVAERLPDSERLRLELCVFRRCQTGRANGSRRYEGGRPWEVSISWASKVGFGLTFSTSVKYCRWYVLRDCFVSLQCHGPLIHYLFYSVSLHSRWCWLFLEGTTHSIVNETCDHSYAHPCRPLILCAHISSYVQYYIILIYFPWQTLPILCILLANLPIHVPNGLGKPWYTYQQHHDLALPHLAPQMWHINSAHMNSAELLRGFFSFYATDFVWGSEASAMDEGMDEGMDEVERRGKKTSEQPDLGIKFIKSRVVLHWILGCFPLKRRKCMIKNHAENRIAAGMSWAYKLQSRRRLYISQPW